MSTERKVRQLNDLFRRELGEPAYGWVHSESNEFLHEFVACDELGNDLYEQVCQCGVGVYVHSPYCKISVMRKQVGLRKIVEIKNRWVLCRKIYPTEAEWVSGFGSLSNYPRSGKWMPMECQGPLALPWGEDPDLDLTNFAIGLIKRNSQLTLADLRDYYEAGVSRKDRQHKDRVKGQIGEILGISSTPGKKNEMSFPHVEPKRKNAVALQ